MPVRTDHTGRVVYVRDGLDGIATNLKYVIYQMESRAGSRDPHPACWIDAANNLRSVVTKEADLVRNIAEQLTRRHKNDASLSDEDVTCVKQAIKRLKSIERGLLTAAKNTQQVKAFLDAIDSGDA